MTGKNPGEHGIYDFYRLNDEFELEVNFADRRKEPAIWDYLTRAGKKSIVINVPFTFPPHKINGIMITDFTTPSLKSRFTYPDDFKQKLLKRFPNYKLSEDSKFSEIESDKINFLRDIFEITEQQFQVTKWLIKENWDFFMITFMGTDHIQHWYWKYMDKTHPEYTEEGNKRYGDKIFQLYYKIDKIINELLKIIPSNTNVVIMSDHGAGPYLKNVYLNNWLRKKGYLYLKSNFRTNFKKVINFLNITPQSLVSLALKLGLGKLNKKTGFKSKKSIFDFISFTYKDVDWNKTKAYSFGYYGSIYLNKKNKEVKDNYEKIREKIIKELRTLKNPETNEPLIDRLWKKEEIYHGKFFDRMPDIIFSMANFSYASSSMFGFASRKIFSKPITLKSGEHRLEGILFLYGPNFKKNKKINDANIIDLAPTILKLFNIDKIFNSDNKRIFDGKILNEYII
jgi:predicted AlkP superfamily phosphohydrolase/phosphomutase